MSLKNISSVDITSSEQDSSDTTNNNSTIDYGYSNSEKVKDFSDTVMLSKGGTPTNRANKISMESSIFLAKMVIDELIELLAASGVPYDARIKCLGNLVVKADSREDLNVPSNDLDAIAEQADAIVDIEYYMKDVAGRNGINTDAIFNLVHEANMKKKNKDGKFDIRSDGKVCKPKDWKPANIKEEVERQMNGFSFRPHYFLKVSI